MRNARAQGYLEVGLVTLLFSGVGLFAKLIPLEAVSTAWGRGFFALLFVSPLFIRIPRSRRTLASSRQSLAVMLAGLCLAGNWYFFFAAIQVSSVAIGVTALFCYPFVTALVEPLFFKQGWKRANLVATILAVIGIGLTQLSSSGAASESVNPALGVVYGLLSGLSFAARNLITRHHVAAQSPIALTWYQLAVAVLALAPFCMPVIESLVHWPTLLKFVLLGGVLTGGSQLIFNHSLKLLSATEASIVLSLQPLAAIALAYFFIGEQADIWTWAGGCVIVIAVLLTVLSPAPPERGQG